MTFLPWGEPRLCRPSRPCLSLWERWPSAARTERVISPCSHLPLHGGGQHNLKGWDATRTKRLPYEEVTFEKQRTKRLPYAEVAFEKQRTKRLPLSRELSPKVTEGEYIGALVAFAGVE